MHQNGQSTMSEGLLRVRARFVAELSGKGRRLCELRSQIGGDAPSHEALKEIGQINHKIAGTASTLGFPALGENSAAIDGAIDQRATSPVSPSSELLHKIDMTIAEIERIQASTG